jgi:protein SCO1/2
MLYKRSQRGLNKKVIFIALSVIILLVVLILYRKFIEAKRAVETEIPTTVILDVPSALPEFDLTAHNGHRFTKRNLLGKWTFMFFGYTHCHMVCPVALIDLNDIYRRLAEMGELIEKQFGVMTQMVFVSVDPERDTVEVLKEYVPHFNKDFIGLTGDPEVIDSLASSVAVRYYRVAIDDNGKDYRVNHTASFILIDPLGRKRAVFPQPHEPEHITKDFLDIRKRFTAESCRALEENFKGISCNYRKRGG